MKREIIDKNEIRKFLESNYVIRLAFHTDTAPYIVPMNYGFEYDGIKLTFYLHSGMHGRTFELAKEKPYIGFEIDFVYEVRTKEHACEFSISYESIIGTGHLYLIEDLDEKIHCLNRLMHQFTEAELWEYPENMLQKTAAFKLIVDNFTMKKNS